MKQSLKKVITAVIISLTFIHIAFIAYAEVTIKKESNEQDATKGMTGLVEVTPNGSDITQSTEELNLAEADNAHDNGWTKLGSDMFSLNDWRSYTKSSKRTNRIKCNVPLVFERNVTLMAEPGFYIDGYWSDNTYCPLAKSIELPANTPFKVNIRRIKERQETADIAVFANALSVSTPLAGIEKYQDTFADISMFERIGICGDSYASGGGIISGKRNLTWGKNLERQCGSIVDIYAKSGQSIHSEKGWNYDEVNGLPALLSGEECGLYWMAHGINSSSKPEQLGNPSDMEAEPKPYTFYGQYVYAIETIKSKFPCARIVITTVTGSSYGLWDTKYAKINEAIRNIAEYCDVPVIDLIDDDFYKSNWYSDNIIQNHPTAMLCSGMAMANRRLFARCVLDNPDYFSQYGSR